MSEHIEKSIPVTVSEKVTREQLGMRAQLVDAVGKLFGHGESGPAEQSLENNRLNFNRAVEPAGKLASLLLKEKNTTPVLQRAAEKLGLSTFNAKTIEQMINSSQEAYAQFLTIVAQALNPLGQLDPVAVAETAGVAGPILLMTAGMAAQPPPHDVPEGRRGARPEPFRVKGRGRDKGERERTQMGQSSWDRVRWEHGTKHAAAAAVLVFFACTAAGATRVGLDFIMNQFKTNVISGPGIDIKDPSTWGSGLNSIFTSIGLKEPSPDQIPDIAYSKWKNSIKTFNEKNVTLSSMSDGSWLRLAKIQNESQVSQLLSNVNTDQETGLQLVVAYGPNWFTSLTAESAMYGYVTEWLGLKDSKILHAVGAKDANDAIALMKADPGLVYKAVCLRNPGNAKLCNLYRAKTTDEYIKVLGGTVENGVFTPGKTDSNYNFTGWGPIPQARLEQKNDAQAKLETKQHSGEQGYNRAHAVLATAQTLSPQADSVDGFIALAQQTQFIETIGRPEDITPYNTNLYADNPSLIYGLITMGSIVVELAKRFPREKLKSMQLALERRKPDFIRRQSR